MSEGNKVLSKCVFIGLLHRFCTINQSVERLSLERTTNLSESLRLTDLNKLCVSSRLSIESHGAAVGAQSAWQPFTRATPKWLWQWFWGCSQCCLFYFFFVRLQHACNVLVMFKWTCTYAQSWWGKNETASSPAKVEVPIERLSLH